MKINVTENKVSIKEEQILNENEYNIHKIQFDFSSEYTDDLVKVALFSIDNHTYKKIISNNECDIPPEVLTQRGYSILGVYAYKTEQDTLVLRYSPSPTRISVYDGSYKAEAENSEPITPSEIEQYQQILQNSLQQFQNQYNVLVEETEGDIQAIEDELQRKVDEGYFDGEDGFSPIAKVIQKSNGATIEIEDKNGKTTADVLNGQDGADGRDGTNGKDGVNGKSAYEIWLDEGNVGTEQDFLNSLKGADGRDGINGQNGKDGINGTNGQDGYTPVKGTDYWTNADKAEIVQSAVTQVETDIQPTITSIENTADTANSTANTAKRIAKGANQALSYSNYQAMITAFNALANDVYNVGQNVMIITLNVPDLWISSIESTSQSYIYTTDEAFTTALETNGYVQVGYYKLSALETQKVDLTEYVTNTDYATSNKGGVFKIQSNYGVDVNNGFLRGIEKTYSSYNIADNVMFVSKGTLENVITGKGLENVNNKVTSISNASTNVQYPSAKAVYDYIQSLDGDEVSY